MIHCSALNELHDTSLDLHFGILYRLHVLHYQLKLISCSELDRPVEDLGNF
jgi:hypothetical protein